jgi:MFS family permease
VDKQLATLVEEYKEMRNEIRASYRIYFSILFGVILTGIAATYVAAFDDEQWLFLWVPFLICSWICIITFIRCNIQHISCYISNIERRINSLCNDKILFYETEHAAKLWFSKIFVLLGTITIIPLIAGYGTSVYRGIQYLKVKKMSCLVDGDTQVIIFLLLSIGVLVVTLGLFMMLPERIRRKKI